MQTAPQSPPSALPLERLLSFTDADLSGNRRGFLSGGQILHLQWSGAGRGLVGCPCLIAGALLALLSDFFPAVVLGLGLLVLGLYLAWRGFAFQADALDGQFAYVTA